MRHDVIKYETWMVLAVPQWDMETYTVIIFNGRREMQTMYRPRSHDEAQELARELRRRLRRYVASQKRGRPLSTRGIFCITEPWTGKEST